MAFSTAFNHAYAILRTAFTGNRIECSVPLTRHAIDILLILQRLGFIRGFCCRLKAGFSKRHGTRRVRSRFATWQDYELVVFMRYVGGIAAVRIFKSLCNPTARSVSVIQLSQITSKSSGEFIILSTSAGVMDHASALYLGLGGILLLVVG